MQNIRTTLTVISLLFTISAAAQPTPPTKAQKDSLKNEIKAMMVGDQKYRWMIQLGEIDERKLDSLKKLDDKEKYKRMQYVHANKVGIPKAQRDSLSDLQSIIDIANFIKLTGIIKQFGFPKKYVPLYYITTILRHNSFLMTEDIFKMLKQEVLNKNMPVSEYTYYYDRTQSDRKLPELYYYDMDGDNSSASHTPKDLEATNKAREEIGLKKIKE